MPSRVQKRRRSQKLTFLGLALGIVLAVAIGFALYALNQQHRF